MVLDVEDIVGAQEIGALLGVGRQRVFQLSCEADFPKPFKVLGMGKVWLTSDIRKWAKRNGRELNG